MEMNKEFIIPFAGLKLGKHQFKYQISNSFFESFDYEEFNSSSIDVTADLLKTSTIMELTLIAEGTVNVNCDLSSEAYDQPLSGALDLVIKFGDVYDDDFEDIVVLPHGDHQLDISQFVYEMIVLSVPQKRIHPGVLDGSLKSELLDKLRDLDPSGSNKQEKEMDPRWDALKKLLTNK
ncbi:MAG: DUF177 domain-containing protein [Eudoraea sp.]|nr:DUF177 domain-containing protein [Eudoraea sp.]